jgi:hypothetical protein
MFVNQRKPFPYDLHMMSENLMLAELYLFKTFSVSYINMVCMNIILTAVN